MLSESLSTYWLGLEILVLMALFVNLSDSFTTASFKCIIFIEERSSLSEIKLHEKSIKLNNMSLNLEVTSMLAKRMKRIFD